MATTIGYTEQYKEIWEGEEGEQREGERSGREREGEEGEVEGRRREGRGGEGGGRKGRERRERRKPYINSRFFVSIAFSSFSGPGVRWETTALRLSWRLQSHTRSLSTEQEVPLS